MLGGAAKFLICEIWSVGRWRTKTPPERELKKRLENTHIHVARGEEISGRKFFWDMAIHFHAAF